MNNIEVTSERQSGGGEQSDLQRLTQLRCRTLNDSRQQCAGGTANLLLGGLSHLPGGVITFTPPQLNAGLGDINTTSANVNGILGGWATISSGAQVVNGIPVATNWATVDASGNIVPYTNHTVYPGSGTIAAIAGPDKNIIFNTSGGPGSSVRVDVDHAPGADAPPTSIRSRSILPTLERREPFGINIGSNTTSFGWASLAVSFLPVFLRSPIRVTNSATERIPGNNPGAQRRAERRHFDRWRRSEHGWRNRFYGGLDQPDRQWLDLLRSRHH